MVISVVLSTSRTGFLTRSNRSAQISSKVSRVTFVEKLMSSNRPSIWEEVGTHMDKVTCTTHTPHTHTHTHIHTYTYTHTPHTHTTHHTHTPHTQTHTLHTHTSSSSCDHACLKNVGWDLGYCHGVGWVGKLQHTSQDNPWSTLATQFRERIKCKILAVIYPQHGNKYSFSTKSVKLKSLSMWGAIKFV